MVNMVAPLERIIELKMQDFVQDTLVPAAKNNAPHDSGKLRTSIHGVQTSRFSWIVTTSAVGANGVAYPARIEKGQAVYPRPGNTRGLWYHDRWHSMARASYQSHFMANTVSRFK